MEKQLLKKKSKGLSLEKRKLTVTKLLNYRNFKEPHYKNNNESFLFVVCLSDCFFSLTFPRNKPLKGSAVPGNRVQNSFFFEFSTANNISLNDLSSELFKMLKLPLSGLIQTFSSLIHYQDEEVGVTRLKRILPIKKARRLNKKFIPPNIFNLTDLRH